jgi:hypothetical protein
MVWIGVGQETFDCPKCGNSGSSSIAGSPKKNSSAKKAKAKPKVQRRKDPANLLVPAAQLQRLARLIEEAKKELLKIDHRSFFDASSLIKSRVTFDVLLRLQQIVESEIIDVIRRTQELRDLLDDRQKQIEAAKQFKRNEGITAWGVRRLRESAAGQPSLEAAIQFSELQEKELREIFGKFRSSVEPLRALEKKLREILRTPAGLVWERVPSLSLAQLEKAKKDEPAVKPSGIVSKPKPNNNTFASSKKKILATPQTEVQFPGLEEKTNLEKIANLYPAIASELSQYFVDNNVSLARRFICTNRVWILGQLWLAFFDGSKRQLTDDIQIHEFVKLTSERESGRSVEDQAVILMGMAAAEMTQQEIEIALSIAVEKTGVTLMLNGNYSETLSLLLNHRDRVNPRMIGK